MAERTSLFDALDFVIDPDTKVVWAKDDRYRAIGTASDRELALWALVVSADEQRRYRRA